jgi:hypothetical protein
VKGDRTVYVGVDEYFVYLTDLVEISETLAERLEAKGAIRSVQLVEMTNYNQEVPFEHGYALDGDFTMADLKMAKEVWAEEHESNRRRYITDLLSD